MEEIYIRGKPIWVTQRTVGADGCQRAFSRGHVGAGVHVSGDAGPLPPLYIVSKLLSTAASFIPHLFYFISSRSPSSTAPFLSRWLGVFLACSLLRDRFSPPQSAESWERTHIPGRCRLFVFVWRVRQRFACLPAHSVGLCLTCVCVLKGQR